MGVTTAKLLSSPKHRLAFKEPLEVSIIQYDDTSRTYVEFDRWDIYGEGADLDQAIENWWDDLYGLYSHLSDMDPDTLGRSLKQIKVEMDEMLQVS